MVDLQFVQLKVEKILENKIDGRIVQIENIYESTEFIEKTT